MMDVGESAYMETMEIQMMEGWSQQLVTVRELLLELILQLLMP
jgi:hypothetical protein